MLLVGHLALPFAVRASVGPVGIKERVSAAQRTIAHDHNTLIAAPDRVEHFDGDMVEAVPDHGVVAPL
jgi:hypothetical protein